MRLVRRGAIGLLACAMCAFPVVSCESGSEQSQVPAARTTTSTAPRSTATTAPRSRNERPPSPPTIPATLPPGVTLREPDGSYPAGLPNDPSFFALGVWLETVASKADVRLDRSFGLNMYVALAHDALTDLDAIEASGMHLLVQADEWSGDPRANHPAVDGWMVYDEADLMYGPGWGDWSGTDGWNTCIPMQDQGGQCGYTVMQHFNDRVPHGALRYANYGVGLLNFQSDGEAAVFLNSGFQDVVSADDYVFTSPDADAADRKGSSYGRIVNRIRNLDGLDGVHQPIWAFVEIGHPFTEDAAPTITATQMRSAVWHSIIAGAQGIVYFNHSFGGRCPTSSVLREGCDPDMRSAVTRVNSHVTELANVLNAPFADGYVAANGAVKVMAKLGPDGAWYVFAGADSARGAVGDVTFSVATGSSVEVLFENRNLTMRDGQFRDEFADNDAVHIYRVT
jgi:hypothetical protein